MGMIFEDNLKVAKIISNTIMAKIKVGQRAPDLALTTKEETPIQLSAAWGNGRHALIIFLRHLA